MFESFKRSWELTKLSFSVIRADKELLLFPILGAIFSLGYIMLLLFPTIIAGLLSEATQSYVLDSFAVVLLFLVYFGLAVIGTFFNVCAIYTIKKRFEGGDATFSESISFALSKLHLVFAWGLLAATVGMLFRVLDAFAEKLGRTGQMIMAIISSILGTLWAVVTVFVVPAMVYHNVGPIDAIKKSVSALKKTWGESLIRYYGLGLVEGMLIGVGIVGTILVGLLVAPLGLRVILPVVVCGVIYIVLVSLIFSVANAVFNTALYAYAHGKVPKGYSKDLLQHAFKRKDMKIHGFV